MSTIRVAIMRPAERVTFEEIENDLPAQQKIVGGYIEPLFLPDGLVVVFNEEGQHLGLTPNRFIEGSPLHRVLLHGTFFVARKYGSELTSITPEDELHLVQWGPLQGWRVA
jgi:hypothetical protein